MKSTACNKMLVVALASLGLLSTMCCSAEPISVVWESHPSPPDFSTEGYRYATVFQDKLYVMQSGHLVATDDGENWSVVDAALPDVADYPVRFFAVSDQLVLWIGVRDKVYVSGDGTHWAIQPVFFPGFLETYSMHVYQDSVLALTGGWPLPNKLASGPGVEWYFGTGVLRWLNGVDLLGGIDRDNCPGYAMTYGSITSFRDAIVVLGGFNDRDLPYRAGVYAMSDYLHWGGYRPYMPHHQHYAHAAEEYQHLLWLVGGHGGPQLSYTADLINWSEDVAQPGWPGELERPSVVVFKDRLWVFGGMLQTGFDNTDIWTMRLADGQDTPPDLGPLVVPEERYHYVSCAPPPYEGEVEVPTGTYYTADMDRNNGISLRELLTVIMLYNWGTFHCDILADTGFARGSGRIDCTAHSADFAPQDWHMSLAEVLRVIQLYNSDYYLACDDSEDGYCLHDY